MTDSSINRETDIVGDLNQKALLSLAADPVDSDQPRSYQMPTIEELSGKFPDLEIVEVLGTGGMGCVFKARQRKLDRFVALKILPRELASDGLFAERFSREARAMARLNHPNIVSIHDYGQQDDVYYLIMEYMDGMNLRELLDAKACDPQQAIGVFQQVCDALAYAHAEGVIHRDIKPENILFNRQGHVALADFGLARLAMDSNCEVSLTQTRQAMGTLNYMAPEQWENPKAVDHRADIYALGVLLYELMTGRVPRGNFPPISSVCPSAPNVDGIVDRALQVSPDDRHQSVVELRAALSGSPTGEFDPSFHMNEHGTFTNFRHIAAAPLRLAKKVDEAVSARSEKKSRWRPSLSLLTFAAAAVAFLLMMASWHDAESRAIRIGVFGDRYVPQPKAAFFEIGMGGFPNYFVFVLLLILGTANRYRTVMHPMRWFAIAVGCLFGCFLIPSNHLRANGLYFAYMWLIGLLSLEHFLVVCRDTIGWIADGKSKRSVRDSLKRMDKQKENLVIEPVNAPPEEYWRKPYR